MAVDLTGLPMDYAPTSYSGLGNAWQGFGTGQVMPILQNLLSAYPNLVNQNYGQAAGGIQNAYQQGVQGMGNFTQQQLKPAMQNTLNSLGSRNVLNSSVAGDALSKTMTGIGTNSLGMMGNMMGQQSSMLGGLYGQQANAAMQYPNFALQTAGTGQYSTQKDPTEMYRIWASLMAGTM